MLLTTEKRLQAEQLHLPLALYEVRGVGVGGAGALYTVAVAAMSSNVRVNHSWSVL